MQAGQGIAGVLGMVAMVRLAIVWRSYRESVGVSIGKGRIVRVLEGLLVQYLWYEGHESS